MDDIGIGGPVSCDARESSDLVRFIESAMVVCTACGRGWNIEDAVGATSEAHEPSR